MSGDSSAEWHNPITEHVSLLCGRDVPCWLWYVMGLIRYMLWILSGNFLFKCQLKDFAYGLSDFMRWRWLNIISYYLGKDTINLVCNTNAFNGHCLQIQWTRKASFLFRPQICLIYFKVILKGLDSVSFVMWKGAAGWSQMHSMYSFFPLRHVQWLPLWRALNSTLWAC